MENRKQKRLLNRLSPLHPLIFWTFSKHNVSAENSSSDAHNIEYDPFKELIWKLLTLTYGSNMSDYCILEREWLMLFVSQIYLGVSIPKIEKLKKKQQPENPLQAEK